MLASNGKKSSLVLSPVYSHPHCSLPRLPPVFAYHASLTADVPRVLESIKAGRRLPEARFANLKVAPRGQQSVYGAFAVAKSADSASPQEAPTQSLQR